MGRMFREIQIEIPRMNTGGQVYFQLKDFHRYKIGINSKILDSQKPDAPLQNTKSTHE
jgi:hypothetical protein